MRIIKHITRKKETADSQKRTIELLQSQVLDLTVEINTLTRRIEGLTSILMVGYDITITQKESK